MPKFAHEKVTRGIKPTDELSRFDACIVAGTFE
jgi:hypothetical protein